MYIECRYCNKKFSVIDDEDALMSKLVSCTHCNETWIYQNKIEQLESLLNDLEEDLGRTEIEIKELSIRHNQRINELEIEVRNKKKEIIKQNLLEEKINTFEKRITQTEKSNSIQADLENKIYKMEGEEKELSNNILVKHENIKKKTDYLKMKVSSYNTNQTNLKIEDSMIIKDDKHEKGIIDFNNYENNEKKKKLKSKFYWPNMSKPKF